MRFKFYLVHAFLLAVDLSFMAGADQGLFPMGSRRLLISLAGQQRVQGAVSAITVDIQGEHGLQCSGVFVSSHGHFLTNMHCLRPVLQAAGFVSVHREYSDQARSGRLVPIEYIEQSQPLPPGGYETTGIHRVGDETTRPVRILFIGAGYISDYPDFDDRGAPAVSEAMRQIIEGGDQDVALIHFTDLPVPTPCLHRASNQSRSSIWGLGYPSVGQGHARWSQGHILENYQASQIGEGATFLDASAWDALYLGRGRFLTDLEAHAGSSGEPIVDERGDLVGIVYMAASTPGHYIYGSTQGLSIDRIMQLMQGTSEFNCR